MNVLAMHALLGAYTDEGMAWLDELLQVLNNNINFAFDYIHTHFEGISVSRPQGTYMLFLDCSSWCEKHNKSIDQLLRAGWEDRKSVV